MGGHGALFLAMRHTDLFGACGSMSGGVDIRPFPLNWNIPDVLGEMASNKQSWDEHSVMGQLKRIKNGDLWITFDCGEADFFLEVNKDLHKRLLGLGIDHDFTTRPGGHTGAYWANSIDYHILFFEKYFRFLLGGKHHKFDVRNILSAFCPQSRSVRQNSVNGFVRQITVRAEIHYFFFNAFAVRIVTRDTAPSGIPHYVAVALCLRSIIAFRRRQRIRKIGKGRDLVFYREQLLRNALIGNFVE